MFDDADDAIEIVNASKRAGLPSSPSWQHKSAVPTRETSYKPLTNIVNRAGVADMIRKRMAMADHSNKKRTTKAPAKRRRVVERGYDEDDEDDDIEDIENSDGEDDDEDEGDIYCDSVDEDEEISEDEELTSGDERFVADDDSEEDTSGSDYSEGEAEFSNGEESEEASSDEEVVPCESDEEEDEPITSKKIVEQQQEIVNAVVSGTRRQVIRKLEPILITVDTRQFHVLV